MLVDLHLSVKYKQLEPDSCLARAWMARFTDGDAKHCAISLPHAVLNILAEVKIMC